MQVAKYWRNKKLRYRLVRSMDHEKIESRLSESQRKEAASKPPATAKRELAGVVA